MVTKEPSELWTGDCVYRAITEDKTPAWTDFFLFMADRAFHIEKIIKPALEEDKIVVSDRYADSTRAYQSNMLSDIASSTFDVYTYIERCMRPWNISPTLTLYIDISVDTSMKRSNGEDKYEKRETMTQVKEEYETLVVPQERCEVIDGERSEDYVEERAIEAVENLL